MYKPFVDLLPDPLPSEQIIALNQPKSDLHSLSSYEWNGWTFEVPPRVFRPGATSRIIYDRILDDTIDVRRRRYAAMGVGLGVETVVAGFRGAATVYAIDIHPDSVETASRNYEHIVGRREGTTFIPVVADVFDGFPDGAQMDVITFNPPAVSQTVSDDPDIVRNVCKGAPLLRTFFTQIAERDLLAAGGEIFLILSNTAELRQIIGYAIECRFTPEVDHLHDWHDGVLTYLFRLQQGNSA